jgi:hypothetical protein
VDQAEVLSCAKEQIKAEHAGFEPGVKASFNLTGFLANLEKYGPGIISSLAPLSGGLTPAALAAVVVSLVQVFTASPTSPAPAPAPAS